MTISTTAAEITAEYGPFPEIDTIHGVTFDGRRVWFASGWSLNAMDPGSGTIVKAWTMPAHAGSAFDGTHLYQIAEATIRKVDPVSGEVVHSIAAPGAGGDSGLAWAEGSLWVGHHRERQIHQLDPMTGALLRTIQCDRLVTGVSWVNGELWHGAWDAEGSELRNIDPETGVAKKRIVMPPGVKVSGLESDGGERFFCGGSSSGKLWAVRRP